MNFTGHTASMALEELAKVGLQNIEHIETTELDSLAAILNSELEDRGRRDQEAAEYAKELPF